MLQEQSSFTLKILGFLLTLITNMDNYLILGLAVEHLLSVRDRVRW
jgi:hypothetical protein